MLDNNDIEIERKNIELWYYKYGDSLKQYYNEIDKMLEANTNDSKKQLLQLFHNKEFQEIFGRDSIIAQLNIIIEIYKTEVLENSSRSILDQFTNIEKLVQLFLSFKFKLWRLETRFNEEIKKQVVEYIEKNNISDHFIIGVILTSCFNKIQVIYNITDAMRGNNWQQRTITFLQNILLKFPNEEIINCLLIDVYVEVGQMERANILYNGMKVKTKITETYNEKWGFVNE